ncbi:hypothetical protein TIFTF001_006772 [Ficus carica]|uniref:Uncharacterized protein n=1 Tax=Ficus carica TaxID=3494 RepID=A0AA87ZRW7_FICCA|nr:hypothetical protein TIFTF001_006772 [Ficus carica]
MIGSFAQPDFRRNKLREIIIGGEDSKPEAPWQLVVIVAGDKYRHLVLSPRLRHHRRRKDQAGHVVLSPICGHRRGLLLSLLHLPLLLLLLVLGIRLRSSSLLHRSTLQSGIHDNLGRYSSIVLARLDLHWLLWYRTALENVEVSSRLSLSRVVSQLSLSLS